MTTATEGMREKMAVEQDERSLHQRMKWFTEKWTRDMDLNKSAAAEFNADLLMVVQAVHRDASRETHMLLARAVSLMPSPFVIKSDGK